MPSLPSDRLVRQQEALGRPENDRSLELTSPDGRTSGMLYDSETGMELRRKLLVQYIVSQTVAAWRSRGPAKSRVELARSFKVANVRIPPVFLLLTG